MADALVDDAHWTDGRRGCLKEGPRRRSGEWMVEVEKYSCHAMPCTASASKPGPDQNRTGQNGRYAQLHSKDETG